MAQPCALTDFKKRLQMGYKMVTGLQKEVTKRLQAYKREINIFSSLQVYPLPAIA